MIMHPLLRPAVLYSDIESFARSLFALARLRFGCQWQMETLRLHGRVITV